MFAGLSTRHRVAIFALTCMVGAFFLLDPFQKSQRNSFTGREQRIDLTPEEEVQLGLHIAPQLAIQYQGISKDFTAKNRVRTLGQKLVRSAALSGSPYKFDFHVLADTVVSQAFTLPGGQIFITCAFLKELKTDNQLAAVLGHEIGHVFGKHVTVHLRSGRAQKTSATYTEDSPREVAEDVEKLSEMSFSSADEQEADAFAVELMLGAGYVPNALLQIKSTDFRAKHALSVESPKDITILKNDSGLLPRKPQK